MAKDKVYSSILDSFLDLNDNTPNWKELGLKEAVTSGEEVLSRTHTEVDDLLDSLTDGHVSKNASNPLEARMAEKESGAPRISGNRTAQTHIASPEDYNNPTGESLISELTMPLESAAKANTIEKKSESDAAIRSWVNSLFAKGESKKKVTAKVEKLAAMLGMSVAEYNHIMHINEAEEDKMPNLVDIARQLGEQ